MFTLAVYLFFGVLVGLLAGLLGLGGGIILVPILDFTLPLENIDPAILHHMALATSMASIMFTSLSSTRSHSRHGSVRWDIIRGMAPGLVAGMLAGTFVVLDIPGRPLKIVFAIFLTCTAAQMILDMAPKASFHLPKKGGLLLSGLAIGMLSSFLGVVGGSMIVPFLLMCRVPMINVIGTTAAMGFPVAVAGTAGFIINGWGIPLLPDHSLGLIYLPALIGLVAASMVTAPLGVKLSHALPVRTLKRCFGILLFAMAARMIYGLM